MGDIGDTTDELPSIRATRRLAYVALCLGAAAALAFAAVLTVRPPRGASAVAPAVAPAIDAEAQRLAKVIDATTASARSQAASMADKEQIRAGILTDAATVKDLVTSEIQLPRNLSQTLELVQHRGKDRQVLLSLPDGSPPIAPLAGNVTEIALDGRKDLAVVLAIPINPVAAGADTPTTGELLLSTPLDFALTRDALAAVATRVVVTADHGSATVIPGTDTEGAIHQPLKLSAGTATLDVTPVMASVPASWAAPARIVAVGVAFVALLALGLSLYRNRAP